MLCRSEEHIRSEVGGCKVINEKGGPPIVIERIKELLKSIKTQRMCNNRLTEQQPCNCPDDKNQ